MEPDRLAKDLIALRLKAFNLIKERSFERREVVLSSGKKSNYYLDLKPTMMHPEGINLLCELIYDRLIRLPSVHYVGGLELGAVPIIGPLTIFAFMKGRHIPGFFVRKEVKTHGTKKLIEGVSDGELRGQNVIILDDVTTEGESAMNRTGRVVLAWALGLGIVVAVAPWTDEAQKMCRESHCERGQLRACAV